LPTQGLADDESVGEVGDGSRVGAPDDGLPDVLGVWLGVAVVDLVGVLLGVGERLVRLGRGVLVCEGVAVGVGATAVIGGGGRTSR
jgi:hypothetical protein